MREFRDFCIERELKGKQIGSHSSTTNIKNSMGKFEAFMEFSSYFPLFLIQKFENFP